MWPPLVSGLLCLLAVILLLGGWLGNSDIRQSNLTTGFAAGLPPVRQAVSLAISLPPAGLSIEPLPELDTWQVVLAEPPSRSEAEQVPADPTPTAGAANGPPVDLVQPAIAVEIGKPRASSSRESTPTERHSGDRCVASAERAAAPVSDRVGAPAGRWLAAVPPARPARTLGASARSGFRGGPLPARSPRPFAASLLPRAGFPAKRHPRAGQGHCNPPGG